jgi:hypothetical protein
MFVRWNRRERKARTRWVNGQPHTCRKALLTAALVRSERRGGKPRQKVVAYLGSIAEEAAQELLARESFWLAASARLDSLNLAPEQREKVEAALHARVNRLTAEEAQEAKQERTRRKAAFVQAVLRCGGDPSGLAELLK